MEYVGLMERESSRMLFSLAPNTIEVYFGHEISEKHDQYWSSCKNFKMLARKINQRGGGPNRAGCRRWVDLLRQQSKYSGIIKKGNSLHNLNFLRHIFDPSDIKFVSKIY